MKALVLVNLTALTPLHKSLILGLYSSVSSALKGSVDGEVFNYVELGKVVT